MSENDVPVGVPTGAPLRYTRYCHTRPVDAFHVRLTWVGLTDEGAKPVGAMSGLLSAPVTPIRTVSVTTAPDEVCTSRVMTCMPAVSVTKGLTPLAISVPPSFHVQSVIALEGETLPD